jgi:nitroimidazol reductase NimA-like FMN-containing flavoprotein (pyridoxamine 5'-phosphate oxidase superfamily)
MAAQAPEKYSDLFKKKAFANLGTLMKDGSPQVTPVWFDYDGKHVRVNSALGRVKDKNIRRDPRVSLSIQDPENPYRHMEVRGNQQLVAKIFGQPRIPVPPAGRSARHIQDRAGSIQHHGLIHLTATVRYKR